MPLDGGVAPEVVGRSSAEVVGRSLRSLVGCRSWEKYSAKRWLTDADLTKIEHRKKLFILLPVQK